jgi:hypothetical protein
MVLATAFSCVDPTLVEEPAALEEAEEDVFRDSCSRLRSTRSEPIPRVSAFFCAVHALYISAQTQAVPSGSRQRHASPSHLTAHPAPPRRRAPMPTHQLNLPCTVISPQSNTIPNPSLHQRDQEDVCWICLDPAGAHGTLERPCACPRSVHAMCLARWQLHSAGREWVSLRPRMRAVSADCGANEAVRAWLP